MTLRVEVVGDDEWKIHTPRGDYKIKGYTNHAPPTCGGYFYDIYPPDSDVKLKLPGITSLHTAESVVTEHYTK
jgi:hypothetical protein